MKFLIFILMFFILGALLIISNENIYVGNQQGLNLFFNPYLNWLNSVYFNFQNIFSSVIGLDWIPE
jgi:hypothetical protein